MIEKQNRQGVLSVVGMNTQGLKQCLMEAEKELSANDTEENRLRVASLTGQYEDHQDLFSVVTCYFAVIDSSKQETMKRSVDEHISALEEEISQTKDLEYLKRLEYNVDCWKNIQEILTFVCKKFR